MQWEALSKDLRNILAERQALFAVICLALGLPTFALFKNGRAPLLDELDRHFWKDVHAADLCGYAELRPIFDTDNGGLAAYPTPLPGG